MAKMIGATRIAMLKSKKTEHDKMGGRKGALKHICKGLRSPNHEDVGRAK